MRAFTRLGASVFATVLSLMTIIALLPKSRVSEHLKKIQIGGTSINDVTDKVWKWTGSVDGIIPGSKSGLRLVVFGDSWVDDRIEEHGEGKGRSWTEVLCEELRCVSHINMATSQPSNSYPSSPPTGALASNEMYLLSTTNLNDTASIPELEEKMLPDFKAQIQSYIALPPPDKRVTDTIFVLSFGTWDVWHLASQDLSKAQETILATVEEMFYQLDNLYAHYRETLKSVEKPTSVNGTATGPKPQFRVVIPKLFDPTMLPGWMSQRPVPLRPDSIAENQKNAISLLSKWDNAVENKLKPWFATAPEITSTELWTDDNPELAAEAAPSTDEISDSFDQGIKKSDDAKNKKRAGEDSPPYALPGTEPKNMIPSEEDTALQPPQKDVFYYDLQKFLVEIILEHHLEDEGITDASGLGTHESDFISVYDACLREAEDDSTDDGEGKILVTKEVKFEKEERRVDGKIDVNGFIVCDQPEDYLFWDDFNIGSKAKTKIGKEIAKMVNEQHTLRASWNGGKLPGT